METKEKKNKNSKKNSSNESSPPPKAKKRVVKENANNLTTQTNKKETKSKSKKRKKIKITKEKLTYILLSIADIAIIIYAAKKNFAQYVSIAGSDNIYVGESTKNLIFGKNYITLITTAFFFIYICILNKFAFHKKNTKKFVALILLSLLTINCILFYAFTNKVY